MRNTSGMRGGMVSAVRRTRRQAFTVIELVVVVVIIGTLSAYAAVRLATATQNYRLDYEARRLELLIRTAREYAFERASYEPCGYGVRFFSEYSYTLYSPATAWGGGPPGGEPFGEACNPLPIYEPSGGPPNEVIWGFQPLGTSFRPNNKGQAQIDVGLTQPANALGANLAEQNIRIYFTDDTESPGAFRLPGNPGIPGNPALTALDRFLFYRPSTNGTDGWHNKNPVMPMYRKSFTSPPGGPFPLPLTRIRIEPFDPGTGSPSGPYIRLRIDPDTGLVRRMNAWEP